MFTGLIRNTSVHIKRLDNVMTRIWSEGKTSNICLTKTSPYSTATTAVHSEDHDAVKPFSEMPSPKGLPFVGTLFQQPRDTSKQRAFLEERCAQFFPVYKETVLNMTVVVLYDMDEIAKLVRTEAKHPMRFDLVPWTHYREIAGEAKGLITSEHEHWHRMRRVIDKPMLRIKEVSGYADDVNEVVTDFLSRLETITGKDGLVPDLENELFNWSLETIGKILYERRFGGISDDRSPEMQEFIDSIRPLFLKTIQMIAFPTWFNKIFLRSTYKQHNHCWDILFRVAKKCVDDRMKEIEMSRQKGEDNVAGVLSYLLSENSLPVEEIYSNITELMMGAVDTTSTAMLWILQELALNPEVQDKLLKEVEGVLPDGRQPTYKDLQNMPYQKAVIKETLRLYSVASGLSRILQEDKVICGYHVPANTILLIHTQVMNRLPLYFDDPLVFRPERWLRDNTNKPNPFSQLPFGYGTRMCVGRRVAELEINMLLSRLIRKFSIEPCFTERAGERSEMVLKPDSPLKLKLIERN